MDPLRNAFRPFFIASGIPLIPASMTDGVGKYIPGALHTKLSKDFFHPSNIQAVVPVVIPDRCLNCVPATGIGGI
jgi:hypothetical protein